LRRQQLDVLLCGFGWQVIPTAPSTIRVHAVGSSNGPIAGCSMLLPRCGRICCCLTVATRAWFSVETRAHCRYNRLSHLSLPGMRQTYMLSVLVACHQHQSCGTVLSNLARHCFSTQHTMSCAHIPLHMKVSIVVR